MSDIVLMVVRKMVIKRLDENCPWCNKKTVGQDETGFKACVSCEYDSDSGKGKYKLSNEERADRGMKIYDELVCGKSNPDVRFTTVCAKSKGHKGEHKDSEHPDYTWEDEK